MEQVGYTQTGGHGGDKDIHALVDTLVADKLNPE
jgi:hypothetical protein